MCSSTRTAAAAAPEKSRGKVRDLVRFADNWDLVFMASAATLFASVGVGMACVLLLLQEFFGAAGDNTTFGLAPDISTARTITSFMAIMGAALGVTTSVGNYMAVKAAVSVTWAAWSGRKDIK